MKKNYVSFLLNVVAFDSEDAIRTSGVTVADSFTEKDADFGNYFGGND